MCLLIIRTYNTSKNTNKMMLGDTSCVCVFVNMCRKKGYGCCLFLCLLTVKPECFFSGCCLFVSVRKFNYPMLKFNYLMRVCVVTKILFHFFHHKLKDLTQFFLAFRHHLTYNNVLYIFFCDGMKLKEIVVFCSLVFTWFGL